MGRCRFASLYMGKGCLSIQVLQEFYVNVTQKVAKPLSAEVAAQIMADLSVWEVHCPRVEGVLDAVRLQKRYQISFWDAMILAIAADKDSNIYVADNNGIQKFAGDGTFVTKWHGFSYPEGLMVDEDGRTTNPVSCAAPAPAPGSGPPRRRWSTAVCDFP